MTDEHKDFIKQMVSEGWLKNRDTFGNIYGWYHEKTAKQINFQDAHTYWVMSGKCPVSGVDSINEIDDILRLKGEHVDEARWLNYELQILKTNNNVLNSDLLVLKSELHELEEWRDDALKFMRAKVNDTEEADIVKKALEMAKYADGSHHDTWVVDQMVRVLTNCPMVTKRGVNSDGDEYTFESMGESDEYIQWVKNVMDGEDGSNTYDWEVGIAP